MIHPNWWNSEPQSRVVNSHGWNSGTMGTVNYPTGSVGSRSHCRQLRLHARNTICLGLVRAEGKKKNMRIVPTRWSEWTCLTEVNVECGYVGRIFYLSMYIRCYGRLFKRTSPGRALEGKSGGRIPRIQLSLAFQFPKLRWVVPLKLKFGIPFMLLDRSLLRILYHSLVIVMDTEIKSTTNLCRI